VAVDGGDPAVCRAARAAGALVVVVAPNQGSYAARNTAADAVRPDACALVFTDADCIVEPGWIENHLDALSHAPLSGGAVRFSFRRGRPTPAEWVDSRRHLNQEAYVKRDGFAATCNLAIDADVFRRLRFDARLRTGGDADFCLRAANAGARLVYTSSAVIVHPARDSGRELRGKVRRIASGAPAVRAKQGRDANLGRPRLTLSHWRSARAAGHRVGPVWAFRAAWLDYQCQRIAVAAFRNASTSGAW
jgi:GT2 family glycosyltransferase